MSFCDSDIQNSYIHHFIVIFPGYKLHVPGFQIAAGCQPALWPHFRRLFTEEIENVMLWSAHWNWSLCNVVVNISYQTIKQPRNVFKRFGNVVKKWVERVQKGLGILKRAAKVEKEKKRRILVHRERLILLRVCPSVKQASYVQNHLKFTLYFQGFSRKKVKFQFKTILVTC